MSGRWFTLGCILLAVGFGALGVWQLDRRAWKLDLIARVDARAHTRPASLPAAAEWPKINARDDEYRRVRVQGVLLNDRETLVQAVTELGPGWWVMTPLKTGSGIVLINRGFIPPELRDRVTRRVGAPDGVVSITGLLRVTEPRGGFLRSNDPAGRRWYSRDVAAIAKAQGLQHAAPFFIDADATPNPGGYPAGGLTVIHFRNAHLVYALTWFTLAGLCVFGAVMILRARWTR